MGFDNLRIKKICFVLKYHPNAMHWKATSRTDHFIGIMLSGSSIHNLGGKKLSFTPDSVYFMNQCQSYEVDVQEKGTSYSIHFTTYEPVEMESFCKKIENAESIYRQIEQIDRMWRRNPEGDCHTMAAMYRLCAQIEEIATSPYAPTDRRVADAKEYLNLHFKEKSCLDDAARICGLSRRRFGDVFKAQFHTTPNRYVTMRKIELARKLLGTNGLATAEVAFACGFSDVYYFSKVFTAETGINPSKYRK
ncbi:MAG: helix-turn-helix transcriptional regulator [Clostridia bacterium]|nr:helix-turn-helix transcriptional regulator [Clostridia bacterium]